MRDLTNNLALRQIVLPAVLNATTNGTSIDLQGYDAVEINAIIGVPGVTLSGSVYIDFILQESSDNSVFTAVADSDFIGATIVSTGTGNFARLDANSKASRSYGIGYRGSRRYLRVVPTFTGTHGTGTPLVVLGVLGMPAVSPTV